MKKGKRDKRYYISDFETTSKMQYIIEKETRVYLHYTENLNDDNDNYLGLTIDEWFNWIIKNDDNQKLRKIVYFHNLKFDGLFIEYYINKIGFVFDYSKNKNTYNCIRDINNNVYQYLIYIDDNLIIELRDSYKLIPLSVDNLPNSRGIEKLKDFDYNKIRNEKSIDEFSDNEILYIKHDVRKVKDIIKYLFYEIGDYLTIGSSSYATWKKMYTEKDKYKYIKFFPQIEDDVNKELRNAYNGGLVILNEEFKGKIINHDTIVFDVNSLYPYVMRVKNMPYGLPQKINNENYFNLLKKKGYNLFVYCVEINKISIKNGFHPFISVNKNYYLTKRTYFDSVIKNQLLYMSSIDYDNMMKYYDCDVIIHYNYSYAFKSGYQIFDNYIDKYVKIKNDSRVNNCKYMETISKLRLNSLYGKFGSNPERTNKISRYENGIIEFDTEKTISDNRFYLPLAIFITAYARDILINALQNEREAFIYCDTDSLHLLLSKYKNTLDVDPIKLGAWKSEGIATRSIYHANKQYIRKIKGKEKKKIASLSKDNHDKVTIDNLKSGLIIKNGKKVMCHVKGGNIIDELDFTFT